MRPPARVLLPLVLVLAAALLGTACTSGDDAADAPSAGAPSAGDAPAGDGTAADGAGAAGDAAPLGDPVADEEPQWLYTFTADTATVTGDASGVTVDLADVSDSTTAFTDRPERRTRSESTPGLVAQWDAIFGDDPPNVVISGRDADGPTSVVVEVRDAEVTAPGQLRLSGKLLDGSAPANLSGVAVTVDDATAPPCEAHIPWYDETNPLLEEIVRMNRIELEATTTAAPITMGLPSLGEVTPRAQGLRVTASGSGSGAELPAGSVPTLSRTADGLSATIPAVDSWAEPIADGPVTVQVDVTFVWPENAYSECTATVDVQPAD